jgi:hypothetical protein
MPVPLRTWASCSAGKGTVGQLFDGCGGRRLQGLAIVLSLCFQLIAVSYGQVLIPKSVLSCPDILPVPRFFKASVRNIVNPALQGGKNVRGFYAFYPFLIGLHLGLQLLLIGLHLL